MAHPRMPTKISSRLVRGPRLLEILFEKEARPTLRLLRDLQKRGITPCYKVGRLILFDPTEVREAITAKCRLIVPGLPPCRLGEARIAQVVRPDPVPDAAPVSTTNA